MGVLSAGFAYGFASSTKDSADFVSSGNGGRSDGVDDL
jgi:hypothetical protein